MLYAISFAVEQQQKRVRETGGVMDSKECM